MSDITLPSYQQNTIRSLQAADALGARTADRLNTGKKVDGVADDAVAFFRSQSLSDRASALTARKADTDQSIQALRAALDGTSAVEGLLTQLKAIAGAARGAPLSGRVAATKQFASVSKQLAEIVSDASYQGLNLLSSSAATLTTQFSERSAASFAVKGFGLLGCPTLASRAGGSGTGLFALQPGFLASGRAGFLPPIEKDGSVNFFAFSTVPVNASAGKPVLEGFSNLDVAGPAPTGGTLNGGIETIPASLARDIYASIDGTIDNAIGRIQAVSSSLGVNIAILQARASFASSYSTTLRSGSDKLTLADLSEEAARSQALQVRQQILEQSLAGGGQAGQSILQLLK